MSMFSGIDIPGEWVTQAACNPMNAEFFFPPSSFDNVVATRPTREICDNHCTVREQCLKWALDNDEQNGIWGGMTARQRRDLKNPPSKTHCNLPGCEKSLEESRIQNNADLIRRYCSAKHRLAAQNERVKDARRERKAS